MARATSLATARILCALVVVFWVPAAASAPCAGFTDVDDASPFCASVTWLRNEGITTGCGPGTYCPSDPVSRLAMAAFLKRTADAIVRPLRFYAQTVAAQCAPIKEVRCQAAFLPVPAGQRLLLTSVRASFAPFSGTGHLAVHRNTVGDLLKVTLVASTDLAPFYGHVLVAEVPSDLVFEAGDAPVVELLSPQLIQKTAGSFAVTGYLVDQVP